MSMGIEITVEDEKYTPTRATDGSHGYDLRARVDGGAAIPSGMSAMIPTGVKMAIPHGVAGMVMPRSGLAAKHGVTVLNAPGQIDSDFRGEICVMLINHGRDVFTIRDGDRIAQLVFTPVLLPEFQCVDSLEDTDRGEGGFGHTGVE